MPSSTFPAFVAGIDVGGTNVRCALALHDAPTRILVRKSARTPTGGGLEPILGLIEDLVEACCREKGYDRDRLVAVGSTAPGITDARAGVVIDAGNLPGWQNLPLAALMERRFGVPAVIENDVNAAALGEYAYGAGQGRHSLVYVTVSTGVAAGIVVEGKLLRGFHHCGGELGLLIPDRTHIGTDWGNIGCLELTSAGVGLAREWAALRGGRATPDRARAVFEAAAGDDAEAQALVSRAADYLAIAALAIGVLIDPEVIALGGSIAEHQAVIIDRIREVLTTTMPFPPDVVHATLGADAPLVGVLTLTAEHALVAEAPCH